MGEQNAPAKPASVALDDGVHGKARQFAPMQGMPVEGQGDQRGPGRHDGQTELPCEAEAEIRRSEVRIRKPAGRHHERPRPEFAATRSDAKGLVHMMHPTVQQDSHARV